MIGESCWHPVIHSLEKANMSVVSAAQIAVCPVLVFISADLNGVVDSITVPVLLRV